MIAPLDIFIKTEDGTYVWKAAADNFEVAKSTVQRLASASPGEYMIFSQTTGNKIVVKNGLPEPGTASPHARP
jgi:GTP-dependent phosphoenolpyruvate carboxykinase